MTVKARACGRGAFLVAAAAAAIGCMPRPTPAQPKSPWFAAALPVEVVVGSLGVLAAGVAISSAGEDPRRDLSSGDPVLVWVGGLVGVVGGVGLIVGPSLGHTYAGRTMNTGLGIRIGALALGGIGLAIGEAGDHDDDNKFRGAVIGALAAIVYAVGMITELATSPAAARRYNRRHGVDITVTPVGVLGRF